RLSSEVRIKYLLGERFINAGAFVADSNLHITPRRQQRARRYVNLNIATRACYGPAEGHRLTSVHHQTIDNLLDLPPINFRFPKVVRKIDLGMQIRPIKAEFDRLPEQLFQRGDLFYGRTA